MHPDRRVNMWSCFLLSEAITTSIYTAKNSFKFGKKIADQNAGRFMASLDVESLFTNILLEETISMCRDSLFSNDAKVNNSKRIDFEKLLREALRNNFFNFEGKFYKQIDGVAVGSPLGPTFANAFLYFHERIHGCPDGFEPAYCRRYVYDIFVLFCSPDHLEKLKNWLSSKQKH